MFMKSNIKRNTETIELVKDFNISNQQIKCKITECKEKKHNEKILKRNLKNLKNLNTVSSIVRFLV